jgi:ribulose 1,5-bisphosphate synthetase/thiazole synthase
MATFHLILFLGYATLFSLVESLPIHDVAIIGAGPAGLATAIGIRRTMGQDTSIVIYERTSSLQEIGGQVGLMAPAFNALDCIDSSLSPAVTEAGVTRKAFRLLDENDTIVMENQVEESAKQVVIAWYKLQQVLCNVFLNGAATNDSLQLGCELTTIEEATDHVLLSFQNGHQCRAKIVIGADGNMSRVRSTLFKEESFPEYAGSCIWRMFLRGDYHGIELGESNVWTGDGKVLAIQKMGSGAESRLYVSGQAGWPKDQLHVLDRRRYIGVEDGQDSGGSTRNEDRLERFLESFKDFPSQILDFARKYHDTASILEHPIYFRPVNREWGKGRVTLGK